MKKCSLCNRTYSDESFSFCLEDGSLLSASFDEQETVINPKSFNSNPTSSITIDEPVIAIKINEQYPHVKNSEDLYNCTRSLWRVRKERADKAKYAFAVYKGEVKEVYEIDKWIPSTKETSDYWVERLKSQGRSKDVSGHAKRFEFIGRLAPDEIRDKYIGERMPGVQGQNPIQYFNC